MPLLSKNLARACSITLRCASSSGWCCGLGVCDCDCAGSGDGDGECDSGEGVFG